MTKKNVYLMQIQNPISGKIFLPLPLGYLWGYCQTFSDIAQNYELKDVFVFREKIEEYFESLESPDVVGLSTYVWNWEATKAFAKKVKARWPDCKVVMGGPHVPYRIDFINKCEYVDYIVTYEGEEQFAEFLQENLKDQPDFESIVGLISQKSKSYTKRKSQGNIDAIPSPYLNGFFNNILNRERDKEFNIIVETNRGCPYTCSFCDMQDSYYTKLRTFQLDRVKQELNWASEHKIEYIECADSNFGIFPRDFEIIEHMCQLKENKGYPRSFNFTSAKNQPKNVEKIQEALIENGLKRGISVSLQSFNPKVLAAISRWNSKKDDLDEKLARYEEKGYESYIELILGLPEESKESWVEGICLLLDSGYKGSLLIHPLSVVPNTPFADSNYISKYQLKYTITRSPAQGFCFGTESPEERETICYESATMSAADWVDSYYFGKSLVGAYYYHGLLYYVVEYLSKQHNLQPSQFFRELLDYVKSSDGFLGGEYIESTALLKESLFDLRPWGRKVFGEEDMFWSDQAASAMAGLKNYPEFSKDVLCFIEERLEIPKSERLEDLFRFNFSMLERPGSDNETLESFSYNWKEFFENEKSLSNSGHSYRFQRKSYKDYRDHALNVFWYGRKSRRCFVQGVKNASL